MKKNLTDKEVIAKAQKWLDGISNEALIKRIEEERLSLEGGRAEYLVSLANAEPSIDDSFPGEIETNPESEKDKRTFTWSLNPIEKYEIPASSHSHCTSFLLEAA
ncbi:MAG: hypothetical protein WC369_00250 [Dehalococcoidales bacterium]|jgi:hypothetical protein